jgi:hypothetical protein
MTFILRQIAVFCFVPTDIRVLQTNFSTSGTSYVLVPAAALETDDDRSATHCPDEITVSAGSLVTKLCDIQVYFLFHPPISSRA